MVTSNSSEKMFKFSTRLHVWKNRVKKNGNSSLYLQVYISAAGKSERDYFPLDLEWPMDRIDFEHSVLLPRHKEDMDANDLNMVIMSERSKINEVAKVYRLANRLLTVDALKRELLFIDSSRSVVTYLKRLRDELYKNRQIGYETWKHYGSTIFRIEEFQPAVRFEQINKKWIDKFKGHLKGQGNSHNTIWTRVKELKAMLRHANEEASIHVEESALTYQNKAVENPVVFLDRDEVHRLKGMLHAGELTEAKANILKAFLFSCFTSLRISDLYAAEKSWFLSDNFMYFTMHKGRERRPKTIKIPIMPMAKDFIHNNVEKKLFSLPSQQKFNEALKYIGKKAGVKKTLTSHVARHTFGYLFMTSVGDIYALKEIMGHSKIETTQRYAHLDEQYKLDQVMRVMESF